MLYANKKKNGRVPVQIIGIDSVENEVFYKLNIYRSLEIERVVNSDFCLAFDSVYNLEGVLESNLRTINE